MAVITFSSSFGSGGSVIARRVATRLGWQLHNGEIPVEVASRLSLPLEAALSRDEASDTRVGRLLANFSMHLAPNAGRDIPREVLLGEESFRGQAEAIIRSLAEDSDCVIVGRAAAVVIGNVEKALHVRLDGDRNRRAIAAANALNITVEESTKRLYETDRARSTYVKHFYGLDWADARLYQMVIDSTAFDLDACVELVVLAATARFNLFRTGRTSVS